jgi:hypothetical protein
MSEWWKDAITATLAVALLWGGIGAVLGLLVGAMMLWGVWGFVGFLLTFGIVGTWFSAFDYMRKH